MSKNYILNFGPQHPAAHGVLRMILELEGEKIVDSDPHIGFLHRGTEKLIETKTLLQSIPYFDRLDYVSMLSQEHCFLIACEKLLNIHVPKKALIIRVFMDELTRLMNHIMCITTHALDVGALTPFLWGFEEREHLMSFYEKISGARMHAAYYRLGGVNVDIRLSVLEDIAVFTKRYSKYLDILEDLLSSNLIWKSRLSNIGLISKKKALDFAFSGPVIRGSGIPWDIRKLQPYSLYQKFGFKVPVGLSGDSYSRYYVRLLEMRESLSIINQCLQYFENIAGLPYINSISADSFNSVKNRSKSSMEELIYEFKSKSEGFYMNPGSAYTFVEAPKGEMAVYVESLGDNKLHRCRIKSPGFLHLQGISSISKGEMIADIVTNIGSLDIVFGEVDR